MTKQRYKMTFKCSECSSAFEKITTNQNLTKPKCPYCKKTKEATRLHRMSDGAVPDDFSLKQEKAGKAPNVVYKCESCESKIKIFQDVGEQLKSCPACDSEQVKFICYIDRYTTNEAKTQNKAIDATADIVMQDYKMGNLPDAKQHIGESMAPKLDPVRQGMADNMFAKKKKGPMTVLDLGTGRARSIGNINMGSIVRNAMAGNYRDGAVDPVAAVQRSGRKMPINIINREAK